jgi:GNAT superfamily N-acetyltransferase
MHTLNREDPIWDSFRQDYANFDQWFNRVRADNRPAWTITPDDQLAAVAIAKREDDSPYGLSGRVLKVTNFKVADEHQGRKYGELLLKSIFGFAHGNQYSYIYVTAFEHHSGLIAVLEDFGFTAVDRVDTTDEIVLAKTLLPSGAGDEQLSPLDYHLSLGPPAIHPLSENWFIVPIEPRFHTALFPSPGDQPTLPGIDEWPRGYGNAIKKAYLSRTSSRRVTPGATLLFYRSHDLHAVRAVGIAERIVVSGDPQVLASFVSSRTVYSYPEIENMATDREVVAILFRHDRDLPAPISLRELIDHDALLQAPQSIASCRSEGIEWLKQRISVS